MKRGWIVLLALAFGLVEVENSFAGSGGQVFYRIGSVALSNDRGSEVFTDTLGLVGENNGTGDYSIAAGIDLPLLKDPWLQNTLLGEVFVEYAKFSDKEVLQTTSVVVNDLLNCGPSGTGICPDGAVEKVTVSELAVVVAPKYRFELGKFRPWIIPVGLAFLVNSPPSDDTTYLDYGAHVGVGVEYQLIDFISLGLDYRMTMGAGQSDTENSYSSLGGYLGINF